MHNGVELVEILDDLLEKKGISRRQFCAQIEIPPSTIAAWKHKNILPNTELICKVAKFLNVSIDWLVNGENPKTEISLQAFGRHTIMDRLETILRQNTNSYQTPLAELFNEHLGKIADFELINNWSLGRINVSESIITALAKELNVSTDWLLTGKEETDKEINTFLYGIAKDHEGILMGYHSLDKADQDFVDNFITSKLELRKLQREAKLGQK